MKDVISFASEVPCRYRRAQNSMARVERRYKCARGRMTNECRGRASDGVILTPWKTGPLRCRGLVTPGTVALFRNQMVTPHHDANNCHLPTCAHCPLPPTCWPPGPPCRARWPVLHRNCTPLRAR